MLGNHRTGSRRNHRPGYRILYLTQLQAYSENLGSRPHRFSHRYHQRYRHGNDFHLHTRDNHRCSHHAQLPLRQRFRPLNEFRQSGPRTLRRWHCCCGYALYAWHHARNRCIRTYRRQCRRQCRDERAGRGSAPPHRCTRCPGQHHSRHWQRLRHRFGSPHGPGSAGLLHRGDKDCHVACRRNLDQSGRRNHQRCRCHHPRLHELLPSEPYEPESARGSLHRSHGSLPLLRTHYGSRGPSCPEDGC